MTLQTLQSQQDVSLLSDPNSAEPQQPPYAVNWHRSLKPEFGVLVGICTHLGCIPLFYPGRARPRRWPIGSADISAHATAPNTMPRAASIAVSRHLTIYQCRRTAHLNDTTIRLGENDASATAWSFDLIKQL